MKTTVKWADGAMFVGESGSGHSVVMDGPDDLGGRNLGPRPMEMLLLGTGGCATYDVLSMLKKSRQKVVDCRVELEAERADAVPAVFTSIAMHFVVTGVGLKDESRAWIPWSANGDSRCKVGKASAPSWLAPWSGLRES